jgi:hypothetical protein
VLAVVGCGRLAFEPAHGDGGDGGDGDASQPATCNAITRFGDDFNDSGDVGNMWDGAYADPGTSYAETGGELVLTLAPNAGAAFAAYQTTRFYDLRGQRITTEVTQLANAGAETAFGIRAQPGTHLSMEVRNGVVEVAQTISGTRTSLAQQPYDAAQRYWAIEEHAGQIQLLLSSDGVAFTPVYEGPEPFDVSLVSPMLYAGTDTSIASPGSAHFNSYNGGVSAPGGACPMSTLVDTFDGTTTGNLWGGSFTDTCCTQTVSGGWLTMATSGASGYAGHVSSAGYDLRGGAIIADLAAGPAAGSAYYTTLFARLDAANHLGVEVHATTIAIYGHIGGVTLSMPMPRNAASHVRLREAGGALYFDASADRATWTTLYQLADPFRLDDLIVSIESALDAAGTGDSVSWDAIGLP